MKYGKVWIGCIPDCGENLGGYFCEVWSDEEMDNRIDYFCIHPDDCDCTDSEAVEKFIKEYSRMYN